MQVSFHGTGYTCIRIARDWSDTSLLGLHCFLLKFCLPVVDPSQASSMGFRDRKRDPRG
jgi:hypothetical protein